MYERHHEPLASTEVFARRLALNGLIGFLLLGFSLGIGMLGYHFLENLSWIDSLLNASMILGGMGEIAPLATDAGKVFASAYALFAGAVFLAVSAILVAPVAHRLLHRLNLDEAANGPGPKEARKPRSAPAPRRSSSRRRT